MQWPFYLCIVYIIDFYVNIFDNKIYIIRNAVKKLNTIEIKTVLKDAIIYIVKILIFSVIAALPCYFLRPVLLNLFAGHTRLISQGMPVLLMALIFAVIGIGELVISKDEIVKSILKKIKK